MDDTTPKSSPWTRMRMSGAVQSALDEGDEREWHPVGVTGVMPGHGGILFWDTERPSFWHQPHRLTKHFVNGEPRGWVNARGRVRPKPHGLSG